MCTECPALSENQVDNQDMMIISYVIGDKCASNVSISRDIYVEKKDVWANLSS